MIRRRGIPRNAVDVLVGLAALAIAGSVLRVTNSGARGATIGFVGCFAVDADTASNNDGIWGVGATLVGLGVYFGFRLVGLGYNTIFRHRPG